MELKDLVERMRCPRCSSPDLLLESAAAHCVACGAMLPVQGKTISAHIGEPVLSEQWDQMQKDSVERYQDEHYEEDETVARIFGGFIAVTLQPGDVAFDVGCGLFPSMPAYVRDLELGGYVGLEPLTTPVDRDYVCLTGSVAEKLPLGDQTFDAVLLATSLDHIEYVDQAIAEIKRILTGSGRIYFWVGLNEPEIMAHAKTFHSIFFGAKGLKRLGRIAAAYAEYAYFAWRMFRRKRNLAKGIPLDHAHFRYYTQQSLQAELVRNGLVIKRKLLVPGNNSLLVEALPA